MKILVIADTHFENKNVIETDLMCDRIYEIALREQPTIIVCLGDMVHTHEVIHMGPLNRAIKFLHRLSQLSTHLYNLIGNHDRSSNQSFLTDDSPFSACKLWSNTTIVDKVHIAEHCGNKIVLSPYVPNGRFMEALATENITPENIGDYSIVFAHQEFYGCKMGMMISSSEDKWSPSYPLCISGHIHDHQILQSNLIYPGTPIQLGFGVAPSKGVMIVDIPNNFIQNKNEEITYTFHDLGLPKKMIVHLTPEELSTYTPPDNCFIKLVCIGDTKVIREICKLDSVKEMLSNPNIKLSIKEVKNKIHDATVTLVKTETISYQKRLISYIENQPDDVKSLFQNLFGDSK